MADTEVFYRAMHSGLDVSVVSLDGWGMSFRTPRSGVRNLGRPILAKGVGLRFFVVPIGSGLLRMTGHMFSSRWALLTTYSRECPGRAKPSLAGVLGVHPHVHTEGGRVGQRRVPLMMSTEPSRSRAL